MEDPRGADRDSRLGDYAPQPGDQENADRSGLAQLLGLEGSAVD
jgi:hypothetical protein